MPSPGISVCVTMFYTLGSCFRWVILQLEPSVEPASLFLSDHGAFAFAEPVSELFILTSLPCNPNFTLPGCFPHSHRIPSPLAAGRQLKISEPEECTKSSALLLGSGFLTVVLLSWASKSTENEQEKSPEKACLKQMHLLGFSHPYDLAWQRLKSS